MPFKHNAGSRHKFPKAKYAVKNWAAYNEYLRLRGDVLIWFDPAMLPGWRAGGVRKRGGKLIYSDLAIETCLNSSCGFQVAIAADARLCSLSFQADGFEAACA